MRGLQQQCRGDYEETFAPVVKLSTLRVLHALVAAEDLDPHQMDVETAILNKDLNEEIFMELAE